MVGAGGVESWSGFLPFAGNGAYSHRYGRVEIYTMNAIRARVSPSGRLNLPSALRKAVGLGHGGDVRVELDGGAIRIRTIDEVVTHSQALVRNLIAGKDDASVDAFLAARRDETSD